MEKTGFTQAQIIGVLPQMQIAVGRLIGTGLIQTLCSSRSARDLMQHTRLFRWFLGHGIEVTG